jgi:tol-pal system protein YbgF
MSFISQKRCVLAIMVGVLMTPAISVAQQGDLQERVDRLERIIQGQGLANLIAQVDRLQNEVQRLNGTNEELQHQLEQMQKRQREQYIDLDERISSLPAQQASAPPAPVQQSDSADLVSEAAGAELEAEQASGPSDASTTPPVATGGPVSVENGEAAYQAALQTLRSGQYEQAIVTLSSFPQQYPQSSYLPNVYYWLGEAHYVVRQFEQAITAFQIVLDQYSDSNKAADSLLKRGFSEYELGQNDTAQSTLNQVLQQYPDSSAARLARVRLERIQQTNP